MSPDYSKFKLTPAYRDARQDVRSMIEAFLTPIRAQLKALEDRIAELEDRRPAA